MLRLGRALGVVGSCRDGRPIKLEGNALHPATLGAIDATGQAELLSFYHPARSSVVLRRGAVNTRDSLLDALRPRLETAMAVGGDGLAILSGPLTSPSLAAQLQRLRESMPRLRLCVHDPLEETHRQRGVRLALGRDQDLVHDLSKARVVISLGDDFLSGSPESLALARGFAHGRPPEGDMSRVYVAEPVPTITGASADHRLAASPGELEDLLLALAAEAGARVGVGVGEPPALGAGASAWVRGAAADARSGGAVVMAGPMLPPELHALAVLLNERLSAPVHAIDPVAPDVGNADLADLSADLRAGVVHTLLILDANPVYTAPGDIDFAEAMSHAPFVVHASTLRDETAVRAEWHLPLTHPLESWGDARAFDGSLTLLQPLIRPLYGSWTPQQLVASLTEPVVPDARAIIRAHYRREGGERDESWWRRALHDGAAPGSAFERRELAVDAGGVLRAVRAWREARGGRASTELVIRPDPSVGAGEGSHNEWLQELPRPISKLVWCNALEISPRDAAEAGLTSGDVVRIAAREGEGAVEAAVHVSPGHASGCVSMTLGYGREAHVHGDGPHPRGANAYALRTSDRPWVRSVTIERTGRREHLVTTQHHGRMEGVEPVRTLTLEEFGGGFDWPEEHGDERRIPLSLYPEHPGDKLDRGPQWGMTIDLTACIGCGACTIACQAENNIPWVGPDQVEMGREMHWIRVDRYFRGGPDDPEILHQPVPCMHCEKAPCEPVCPVGATQHSHDGLNEMIYNRCIGTRYCSNNCPYKVRRFNFLKYVHEAEPLRLMRNPEVTVRARGVMEKCTYCVQRIRRVEGEARREGRPVADGELLTACQQTCPTRAIVFGDIADAGSAVSAARARPHRYDLLGELGTRPRTTYLAEVRNPRPAAEGGV